MQSVPVTNPASITNQTRQCAGFCVYGDRMAEIVRLHEPNIGEQSFVACPCGSEGGWHVVVINGASGPFIAALVCGECENEIPVAFGALKG